MNLSGNDKNKITGKKYQPVMSITGLNDQGHSLDDDAVFDLFVAMCQKMLS